MTLDLDGFLNDSLSLLESMLRVPALSRQEGPRADLIQSQLGSWGLEPVRRGHNLILEHIHSPEAPWVWLVSHIDTVPAAEDWSSDPYAAAFSEGRLTALGSNDAGASVVAMLAAFRWIRSQSAKSDRPAESFPFNLAWIAAAEEEVSGAGGIESLLGWLPEPHLVIVGEPTGLRAAVAEKGLLVVDGLVSGKAGHAARNEGENAIYKALPDLDWIRTYRFPRQSEHLGDTRMNLTVIQAGQAHNAVPAECRFTVDIRLTDAYTHEEVLEIIRSHVSAEIQPRSTRLKPSATPPDHPVQHALDSMGIERFGSPTLSDQALIPYPSIKIGPGDSARSHTAGEYIHAREIRDAVDIYVRLLAATYGRSA